MCLSWQIPLIDIARNTLLTDWSQVRARQSHAPLMRDAARSAYSHRMNDRGRTRLGSKVFINHVSRAPSS